MVKTRPTPFPWHFYKQDLRKLNVQSVRFAADALRLLNGARLSKRTVLDRSSGLADSGRNQF